MDTPHILVTGSTRGIGAAIVAAVEGRAQVVGHGRADAPEVIGADLSDPAAADRLWDAALERLGGRIDVLVNNAGINIRGAIDELSYDDFRKVEQVNVDGVWLCSRAVVPHSHHTRRRSVGRPYFRATTRKNSS